MKNLKLIMRGWNNLAVGYVLLLSGTVIASGINLLSGPLSISLIGSEKYSAIALFGIFIILLPILDFGCGLLVLKVSSFNKDQIDKCNIIRQINSMAVAITLILCIFCTIIPKPDKSDIYTQISDFGWIILKLSIFINVKVSFNQTAQIIISSESDYVRTQISISIARYIAPTLFTYIFDDIDAGFISLLLISILIIIITDRKLDLKSLDVRYMFRDVKSFFLFFKEIKWIYVSTISAGALAISDRTLMSIAGDASSFTSYVVTFSLASSINIVIQPFYRILVKKLDGNDQLFNFKLTRSLSIIQSYICAIVFSFIVIYSKDIFEYIFQGLEINQGLLIIFCISFWGAANGWLISTEIMFYRAPALQAALIGIAISIYAITLTVGPKFDSYTVALIWVLHGCLQSFCVPIFAKQKFQWKLYVDWVLNVVIIPLFFSAIILAVCGSLYYISLPLSLVVFILLGFCVLQRIFIKFLSDFRF